MKMIVNFFEDLRKRSWACNEKQLRRMKGHCFCGEESMIVVDIMLICLSHYFEHFEEYVYKELTSTVLHELIHELGEWYPPEHDGLIYESPVSDLANLLLEKV